MRELLVIAALAIPWLNPFTLGPNSASLQTFSTVFVAACFVVYAGPHATLTGRAFTRLIASSWVVSAVVSALIGLLQYSGHSDVLSPWVSYTAAGEAYGNLRQRNQFATLLNIGCAALWWWQAQGWHQHEAAAAVRSNRTQAVLATGVLLLTALLGIGVAASASRTGFFQWLFVCGASVLWQRKVQGALLRPWHLALLALVAYALASVWLPMGVATDGHPQIWERLRSGDANCSSRLILWSNVWTLIQEKPWLGWGPGELAFAHFNHLYDGPRFCEILDNAHNLPLHVAVILGLPAAALLVLGVLAAVLKWRPWREVNLERQLAWSVLALMGFHSLLEYPLWYAPFQLALVLAVFILCGPARRERWLAAGPAHLLAGAAFVAAVYATWDYVRISQIYLAREERLPAYREDTLAKIQSSWLYHDTVQFAALTVTPLTPETAPEILPLAKSMLHFSPEPMVLEKVLEAAQMTGNKADIAYFEPRFQAAYPAPYDQWRKRQPASALR